jgi:hypothetical protein
MAHYCRTRALLYFLANDATVTRLQPQFAGEMRSYGLCADEFTETDNWPPQLYVRESVRLLGSVRLTQHDVTGADAHAGVGGKGAHAIGPSFPSVSTLACVSPCKVKCHAPPPAGT